MAIFDPDGLIATVKGAGFSDHHSIHGPRHWARVERNGLYCARSCGADGEVVTLFALFHDCRRMNDGHDPDHGRRGGAFAERLNGRFFQLEPDRLATLVAACARHTDGETTDDPTIGACWDGDRLDLIRLGIEAAPHYMSTPAGLEIAETGRREALDELAPRVL
ncbi:HD domain-containing protein [Alienimonas californiensis]|uniref:HD domain protein n=1 Tax=Alienimonas californiensis TaxID=2527989 RepID=A0A517P638_9PLAN|nr:hypothetical protein [Alienimonas californiensis]QDT14849.1 hypothetical protein CA12_09290 [Alienimonas californiensis]